MDERREALEARIADDPHDADAWLVLADHLQKLGDPHGELIALQLAAARDPVGKTRTPAQKAFLKAFAKHAPRLLGTLVDDGADPKDPAKGPFVWRCGFIRRAELGPKPDPLANVLTPRMAEGRRLAEFLAHPASRMLGELVIRATDDSDAQKILAALIERRPPQLYELELYARADLGDLSALWDALPRLRRVTIAARSFELGALALPHARRAEFMPLALSPRSMRAIADAPWPVLERLEIRFGGNNLPPHATLSDVVPMIQRTDMPALTTLKLRGAPYAGAILRAIADYPIAEQLVLLDVKDGAYNPKDLEYVSQRKAAFANLRELWMQTSQITLKSVEQALAGVAKHIVTRHVPDALWAELGPIEDRVLDRYRVPPDDD
jgi:uncharacterized protein (TIGR02996 family)